MTELAPEKNLPEAPSSLAGGYRAMDEYVKWSVGPFWQQILGSNKQASFIKRAGEPHSRAFTISLTGSSCCPAVYSAGPEALAIGTALRRVPGTEPFPPR